MQLESLRVLHLKKGREAISSGLLLAAEPGLESVLKIDTCQRKVWVYASESWQAQERDVAIQDSLGGFSYLESLDAYEFLLRWACGLESEVLGETDVFGQIKQAWRDAEKQGDAAILNLSTWMQRLFEDAKAIRSQHLQNLGGSSYGTLVRKVLKERRLDGPILVVGAGQIAYSITPALLESELWLWNRNPVRLCALHEELHCKDLNARLKKLSSLKEEEQAWKLAAHIVVCIPLDAERDKERVRFFLEGNHLLNNSDVSNRSVVHLGSRRAECGIWKQVSGLVCLDDLFAFQGVIGSVRSVQVIQAERACEEKARLRSLGASLSMSHGWEDLAYFDKSVS